MRIRVFAILTLGFTCLGLCVAAVHATTLFGLVDTGELFASMDGGASWTVHATLPMSDAVAIAAAETPSELFLAAHSGSVYRSTDAGASWIAVGAVSAPDVVEMVILANGDILLLTQTGILWRSTDDGATFTTLATLTASNHVSLTSGITGALTALTSTGEVARSTDSGNTWTTVGAVTTSDAVEIRVVGSTLFVLAGSGDVYRSADDGATWMAVGTISQVHSRTMTLHGSAIVAATSEGLVASSADGMTWQWEGSINQLSVTALGNDTPTTTGIGPQSPPPLAPLSMRAPWPNPSGPGNTTTFSFRLSAADDVSIELYNVDGRRVARRGPESFSQGGDHTILWNVGALPSGVYLVQMKTSRGLHAGAKLVIVR